MEELVKMIQQKIMESVADEMNDILIYDETDEIIFDSED